MVDYAQVKIAYGAKIITVLDYVKQQLSISDNSQDEELSLACQVAGEACENYLDNVVALDAVTENISKAFAPVALRFNPYVDGLTVTVDGDDVTADYEVYTDDGLHWAVRERGGFRETRFKQMTIGYNAGFDPLPADLGYAVVVTAVNFRGTGGGGAESGIKKESIVGVGSIEYMTPSELSAAVGGLPSSATVILDKYMRYNA